MTIKECIGETAKILKQIKVPMEHFDDMILPIRAAISNLDSCVEAIDKAEAAQEEKEHEDDNDEERDV